MVTSRANLSAVLATLLLVIAAANVPSARASETPHELVGRWQLAEPYAEVAARVEAAIERVVDDMNFLIRSTARARLREKNGVPRTLVTSRDGERTSVKFGTRRPFVTSGSGWSSVTWGGKPMKIRATSNRAESLRLEIMNDDGTRTNDFVVSDDGVMTLRVRVTAEQLPKDLVYSIRYRRAQ